jgi:hypothetical protein
MSIVFSAPHYHLVSVEELSVDDKVFSPKLESVGTVVAIYDNTAVVKYSPITVFYTKKGYFIDAFGQNNYHAANAKNCFKIISSTDEALNLPTILQDKIDEYKLNLLKLLLRLFEGDYMLINIETQRPVEDIDTVYHYESVIEQVNNGFKLKDNEMFVRMADLPLHILQEYAKDTSEMIKNKFPHLLA